MEKFSLDQIPDYTKNLIVTFINNVDNISELEMFISKERAQALIKERNCQKGKKFNSFEDLTIIDNDIEFLSSISVSKPSKPTKEIAEYISQIKSKIDKKSKTVLISFNKI